MSSDEVEEIQISDCEDSDAIDSDLETELYSLVHHEINSSKKEKEFELLTNDQDARTTGVLHFNQAKQVDELSNKSQENFHKSPSALPFSTHKITNRQNLEEFLMETSSNTSFQELHSESQKFSNFYSVTKLKRKLNKDAKVKQTTEESDSDSVITLSDDAKTKSDLIMNFNGRLNADILDLDSSSNDSLSSKMINLCNDDSPSVGISDIWSFSPLDVDLQTKKSRTKARKMMNKYFCGRCKKLGHPKQFCTLNNGLKCSICAGDHSFYSCTNQICGKCHQVGHFSNQCAIKSKMKCSQCGMKGHRVMDCPDIWRRFHLTTDSTHLEETPKLPQRRPIYCFNCGLEGHFGPTCPHPRSPNLSHPTWSAIIRYKKKFTKFKSEKRKKELEECQVVNTHSSPQSNFTPTSTFPTSPLVSNKNPIYEKLEKAKKRKKQFKLTKAEKTQELLEDFQKAERKHKLWLNRPSKGQDRKQKREELNNTQKSNCTLKSSENDFQRTPKTMSKILKMCRNTIIRVKQAGVEVK